VNCELRFDEMWNVTCVPCRAMPCRAMPCVSECLCVGECVCVCLSGVQLCLHAWVGACMEGVALTHSTTPFSSLLASLTNGYETP
jgi:hypothetical protein